MPISSRYRPFGRPASSSSSSDWTEIPEATNDIRYTLEDLTPGERFEIEVNAVSHHVRSTRPLAVTQIISPPTVKGVEPVLAAENITLEWPRPEGRIDQYHVKW